MMVEPPRHGLPPHLSQTLYALERITSDGWPASVREVQRAVEVGSSQTAHARLHELERRGLARRHPRWRGGWLP